MQFIDVEIENYAISKSKLPSQSCEDIATYTRQNVAISQMLTGQMEMSFIGFMIRSLGVQRILEFGTYTGYSALAMAENLPEQGQVITLDIDPQTAKLAQQFWNRSHHGKKIKQLIGPALASIEQLDGKFDLVFIDADKVNYLNYLKKSLSLLSEKGIILVDNVLWSGKVLQSDNADQSTSAIIQLNEFVANSKDLYATLLPIRDGLFLIKPL